MPGKSPLEKLTKAVIQLEEGLEALHNEAQSCANELVKLGDSLGKQVSNDIQIVLKQLVEEIEKEVASRKAIIEAEFASKLKEELARVEEQGKTNKEAAVQAVLEEMKKIIAGA